MNIVQDDFHSVRFLVQAVYDVLPSPAILHMWGKSESPSCPLCQGRGSRGRLLSSCPIALGEGRYLWRHDQVLKAVAESISTAISASKHHHPPKLAISFVRVGGKNTHRQRQGQVVEWPVPTSRNNSFWGLQTFIKDLSGTTARSGFCQSLGATVSLSYGFHPQINRQAERANQDLEAALRCVAAQNPSTWSTHWPGLDWDKKSA